MQQHDQHIQGQLTLPLGTSVEAIVPTFHVVVGSDGLEVNAPGCGEPGGTCQASSNLSLVIVRLRALNKFSVPTLNYRCLAPVDLNKYRSKLQLRRIPLKVRVISAKII